MTLVCFALLCFALPCFAFACCFALYCFVLHCLAVLLVPWLCFSSLGFGLQCCALLCLALLNCLNSAKEICFGILGQGTSQGGLMNPAWGPSLRNPPPRKKKKGADYLICNLIRKNPLGKPNWGIVAADFKTWQRDRGRQPP